MRGLKSISAPGKVVLCGEYAVLDGAIASVCAFHRRARLKWSTSKGEITPEVAACLEIANQNQVVPAPFTIDTNEFRRGPHKLGLGASAASAVCAAAAVIATQSDGNDLQAYRDEILDLALRAHQAVSPKGSGIDVAASVLGGVLQFQLVEGKPSVQTMRTELSIPLLVVWTGTSASTDQLIQRVQLARQSREEEFNRLLVEMKETSSAFASALDENAPPELVKLAREYGSHMKHLGQLADAPIWTSHMDSIAAVVGKHGGSVKPSGAGGGDIVLAFFADFGAAAACYASLSQSGFECLISALGGPGVQFD